MTARICLIWLLAGSTTMLASCGRAPDIDAALTLQMLPLATPPRSGMPQITVNGDRAILSWLEVASTGATLRFAERTDKGWTEPRTAASGTGWFVNAADVPS